MITNTRYSGTGVVIGQSLVRPQTAGGPATQSRAGSVGSSVSTGLTVTPSVGMLPGSIIAQQARQRGIGLATPNPLADRANWGTGGRKTSPAANGFNPTWLLIGGALLLILMRRKK